MSETPSAAEALLAEPPRASDRDDLAVLLAQRRPRRRLPPLTTALGVATLLAFGVAAGAWADQRWGPGPSSGSAASRGSFAGLGRLAAAGGFGGRFGGGSGTAGTGPVRSPASTPATTGTIRLVDGNTVYVAVAGGRIVRVQATPATTVRSTRASSLRRLRAGERVSVQGTPRADGSLAATSIDEQGGRG